MTIESIKIKLTKDEAVELPLEAARELYEGLHELFGKRKVPSYPLEFEPYWTWYKTWDLDDRGKFSYHVTYNDTLT